MIRKTFCTIDLGAAARNVRAIRASLKSATKMIAVVKADAYGHGLVPFSRVALKNGASCLAVAIVEEGITLREAGITAPIVVLGNNLPDAAEAIVTYDLQPTVCEPSLAKALDAEAKKQGKWVQAHLKVDTGMGRIGIREERELDRMAECLKGCTSLELQGLFTHFANSDGADKGYAHEQFQRFETLHKRLKSHGFNPQLHAANSAAIADLPETHLDMVRAGIMMYGYYPSRNVHRNIPLEPVMSVRTQVDYVKTVPAGETISYDRTYTTWRPTKVATLTVGYGDGYKRALSGKGCVLIRGKRAPILGRVCMDQVMVDVTEIPGVVEGDEAVLLGSMGTERIDADEMAEWANTISYEVLLSFSARVPRVYIED
ncbi:MAG: alanine racemase [Christensenellales bacterium]|jgi:alanine racemase